MPADPQPPSQPEPRVGRCCDACYRGCLDTASAQAAGECYDKNCACHTLPWPAAFDMGDNEEDEL